MASKETSVILPTVTRPIPAKKPPAKFPLTKTLPEKTPLEKIPLEKIPLEKKPKVATLSLMAKLQETVLTDLQLEIRALTPSVDLQRNHLLTLTAQTDD
jgi:hypothetical protein